jgi:diacylglycerol kinase (ATP)
VDVPTWNSVHAFIVRDPDLRVVACGGDGTVNWVVSMMDAFFGHDSRRPPLAVIPFGTGNDMSRTLGWGGGVSASDIDQAAEILDKIRKSNMIRHFDVWSLTVARTDITDSQKFQMLNYFSIGVDAEIAVNFEECRQGRCKCCFCCQCMSLACYLPVGTQSACCKRSLRSYCTIDVEMNETRRRLVPIEKDKTVIFQTIPSMYGGRDPWTAGGMRGVDDRVFEVTFQGGACSLGWFKMGCDTGRPCCQGNKASIIVIEPCTYQVDGEGYVLNGPGCFTLERVGSYPMIYSPNSLV